MKKKLFYTLLIFVVLNSSFICTKGVTSFTIKNNSDEPIYFGISVSYPDTTLLFVNRPPEGDYVPAETTVKDIRGEISFGLNDTVQYFIFDANVIQTEPWEQVKAENKYLKRYVFSEQDIQNSNYTITYP